MPETELNSQQLASAAKPENTGSSSETEKTTRPFEPEDLAKTFDRAIASPYIKTIRELEQKQKNNQISKEEFEEKKQAVLDLAKEKGIELELDKPFVWEEVELPQFPGVKVLRGELTIGGESKEELIAKLSEVDEEGKPKFIISKSSGHMMNRASFTTAEKFKNINLIRLSVKDLGLPNAATADQVYQVAEELGLELCPAEVGLQLLLKKY